MLALQSTAYELLYGGQGGGGKTDELLIDAVRYCDTVGYHAIIFRRTFAMLSQPGGIIDRSRELFRDHASYNSEKYRWQFPSGATLTFGHMQYVSDRHNYDGGQFAFAGFDQLEQFQENQYVYIMSRTRSMAGVPVRIRATANPPSESLRDVGDLTWVYRRFLPWLGTDEDLEQAKLPRAQDGEKLWYNKSGEIVPPGTPKAVARTFIKATVFDNTALLKADPGYVDRLEQLPYLDRERILHGNWHIRAAGNVFKREWFRYSEVVPEGLNWVRYWDLAASVKARADYTASAAVALDPEGNLFIRDMIRDKWLWPEQTKMMKDQFLNEPGVQHGIESDLLGSTAFLEFLKDADLASKHIDIRGVKPEKDKLTRALAWSRRAEKGRVILVRGPWINDFLGEAVTFDGAGKSHDDQIDTVSGGAQMLGLERWKERAFLHV